MKSTDWTSIRHFAPKEFDSPDAPESGLQMDLEFVRKLDELRELLAHPLIIRSGYRTKSHNARVGGVDSSAHEAGRAADVMCECSTVRANILRHAIALGFRRIGIGKTFIHLDDDPTKPQDVAWLY